MAKGLAVVAISSISVFIMFCVMIFLMSNVDPPAKFKEKEEPKADFRTSSSPSEPSDDAGRRAGGMYFDDNGVLPIVDTVQYGLEKIDTDVIDFYRSTKKPSLTYQNKDRKVIPPLWPRATQEVIVNPTMHKVMPPIWPTTSVIIDTVVSRSTRRKQQDNSTSVETTSEPTKPNVKPMKRRSVNNYILDEDDNSLILKVLDFNGQSKIEIKIWSDIFLHKNKEKRTKHSENKSNYALKPDKNAQHKTAESAKNTVVTICANDSVVIEESEGKNVTELLKSISFYSTRDENETYFTDLLQVSPKNKTVNEDNLTKMLLVNKTNSTENTINSSDFEVSNNSNISVSVMKYEISSNTTNNSSVFGIISDAKTNNTEFSKIIFNEEVNIVTAETNHPNAADNDNISINDVYPSNFTNLFIESDSDMVY